MSGESAKTEPVLAFGVIADLHYADKEDGQNYRKTATRYYRRALQHLKNMLETWESDTLCKPAFVLQLGDAIDGVNKSMEASESALQRVLAEMKSFSGTWYHIWGNHEFYNFTREFLMKSSLFSGNELQCSVMPGNAYYAIEPHPQLRILSLDTYEISLLGYPEEAPQYQTALKIMSINPNEDQNSPIGLEYEDLMFVKYNGGLDMGQLNWLETNLQEAIVKKQNILVIGHIPLHPNSTDMTCLCWNYQEVLSVLQQYASCVLCYMAGHDHTGGSAIDSAGILHLTLNGVIENKKECDAATVYLYQDKLEIVGNGRVRNYSVGLKFPLAKN
ncbi:hypothetical protein ACJMK2_033972 [Sinanodonta woodiana]